MADRWQALAGDLSVGAPSGCRLSCQASAGAVNTVHADIAVATAAATARVQASATEVATADTRYTINEVSSASKLAAAGPEKQV